MRSLRKLYEDITGEEIYRRLLEDRLYSSTFMICQPRYDPIFTPIFTAILGTTVATTTIVGTLTVAGALSAIATTALTFGIQALLAPKPPKPEDGKVPETNAVPYRRWGVGRNRIAGSRMLLESKGSSLVSVQAIAGHRIKSINRYWLHDDEVEIGPDGVTTEDDGGRYGDNVTILSRLGMVPETAFAEVVALFGSDPNPAWSGDHRGDGQASIAMIARSIDYTHQGERFPYGAPSLSVEADMALCWDFRNPDQHPDDQETWEWTQNSAIILCWHMCFSEFGHRRDYRRAILPMLAMWQEEADICDEDVMLAAGGTERRYECNGWDTAENDPKVGTNAILATCDGWLCERGDGALLFTVGKFRETRCGVLTDADILGHNIAEDVIFADEINRLVPKFTYPEIGYATSDTDAYEDVDAQLIAGRVLVQEADYAWVHKWRQTRRLGRREWLRIQQKIRGSLDVKLSGINSVDYRWNRLETPVRLPELNGIIIENRSSVLALTNGGYSMDFIRHPDDIDDWVPSEMEGTQPPVPDKPNVDDIITPVITSVLAVKKSGSVYLRVTIQDINDDLTPALHYRVQDNGAGQPGAWVLQTFPDAVEDGGGIELATSAVPTDEILDVEAAVVTSDGAFSNWSVTQVISTDIDTVAPKALKAFAVANADAHLGNAPLSFTVGNDGHINRIAIYRVAAGGTLNVATDLVEEIGAAPGTSFTHVDGVAGTDIVVNGDFASATGWTATQFVISGGVAAKSSTGTPGDVARSYALTSGGTYRYAVDVVSASGSGAFSVRLTGTTNVASNVGPTLGTHVGSLVANPSSNALGIFAASARIVSADNLRMFQEASDNAPQGVWDYYATPLNVSGKPGPTAGPATLTII